MKIILSMSSCCEYDHQQRQIYFILFGCIVHFYVIFNIFKQSLPIDGKFNLSTHNAGDMLCWALSKVNIGKNELSAANIDFDNLIKF